MVLLRPRDDDERDGGDTAVPGWLRGEPEVPDMSVFDRSLVATISFLSLLSCMTLTCLRSWRVVATPGSRTVAGMGCLFMKDTVPRRVCDSEWPRSKWSLRSNDYCLTWRVPRRNRCRTNENCRYCGRPSW